MGVRFKTGGACVECQVIKARKYRASNPEKTRFHVKKWHENNKEHTKKYAKKYRFINSNLYAYHTAKRKNLVKLATPKWSDDEQIRNIYIEAQYQQMHVDHIVPINSEFVCGLHCEDNLQLLTQNQNSKKHNKIWPDQWNK